MSSSFFEINIAMSGLFAAQRGMAVTGNNITNAATPGYSRQILEQKASSPLNGMGTGMLGTGVQTTQIQRIRDSYIDQKLWSHNDTLGEYKVKMEQNSLVESVFGEPSDAGFTTVFNNVFQALDDLSKMPSEGERKEALKQNLISFTKYFNTASETLSNYQRDLNFELSAKVDEINMLSGRIQSLNKQIYEQEMHGDVANSLRDERDLCVDKLSQLINIEAKEVEITKADGSKELQFQVKANGQPLVDHMNVNFLKVEARTDKQNPQDGEGLFDIKWENGLPFDTQDQDLSGELKGIIDMRDGAGIDGYRGIPYYIKKLDEFASTFATKMNEVYGQGDEKYKLFEETPGGIKASTFSVSADILTSASNIRTNYEDDPLGGTNPNPSNNDLLLDLLGQKDNSNMFEAGDPKDFMISMFSELGISTKEANMYYKSQKNVTNVINNQRLSVSQVDTNEEFMNLVKYNQAYQVAAKLISTADELYETTIFKLGNW